jgi:hypothetical protein
MLLSTSFCPTLACTILNKSQDILEAKGSINTYINNIIIMIYADLLKTKLDGKGYRFLPEREVCSILFEECATDLIGPWTV